MKNAVPNIDVLKRAALRDEALGALRDRPLPQCACPAEVEAQKNCPRTSILIVTLSEDPDYLAGGAVAERRRRPWAVRLHGLVKFAPVRAAAVRAVELEFGAGVRDTLGEPTCR